jgi:signal transduction histidine kinase
MIKSLYIRNVLFYVVSIFFTLILTFFLTFFFFQSEELKSLEENLLKSGKEFIRIMESSDRATIEGNLNAISDFSIINFYILDHDKNLVYSSTAENTLGVEEAAVKTVLGGGDYRGYSKTKEAWMVPRVLVGLPFEKNGEKYALFIKPGANDRFATIQNILLTALFCVLVIGSFFIMLTTKYLVKPITTMTKATEELAKGNLQFRVDSNRKDEIGKLANSFNRMAGELEKVENMRRDFVANVSHELQSPLTSIRGLVIAMKDGLVNKQEEKNYLSIIEDDTLRLSNLSQQLLHLASLESGKYPYHLTEYRLDRQLRNAIVSLQPMWEDKHLDLALELSSMTIQADEELLYQLWINLLSNAIKYNVEHGKLSVACSETVEDVQVKISDSGIGISQEDLPYIFERFYKADKSHQKDGKSYGIGLAIAKRILEIHHGEIRIDSTIGIGTEVCVILPKKSS